MAFRYIAANTHPDHDTLANFRKTFLVELEDLFVQVLTLAQSMKLVRLGRIALDGTKVKADASKHKALSHGHLEKPVLSLVEGIEAQLRSEVRALLAKAEEADEELLADNGYLSATNVKACVDQEIEPWIALGREAHHMPLEARLARDAPAPGSDDPLVRMAWRLKTKEGRARYGRRKCTVEPVFGIIKHVMGFRRFSLRGLAAVAGEWKRVTLAFNLKRMHVLSCA